MQQERKSKIKAVIQVSFLILVFGLTMYSVFHGEDLGQIIRYLKEAEISYLAVGVLLVVLFILSESLIIWYMMWTVGQRAQLSHCCLYSFAGFFFSAITPSASGGQPAQLYFMKKDQLPISVSTLILMIVTITYKAVLVLLGLAVLILRPPSVMCYLEPVLGWCYLGIALNVGCVAAMLVLVFHPTLARRLLTGMIEWVTRLFHWKKGDSFRKRAENSMNRYCEVAGYFKEHKRVVFHVMLITLVQRFLLFFVTYLTYQSLGIQTYQLACSNKIPEAGVGVIVLLQGMISVAVDMLPLPGGMGISEALFLKIFQPLCGKALTLPLMILSRGLSYYTQLLICGVMTVAAYIKIGKKA